MAIRKWLTVTCYCFIPLCVLYFYYYGSGLLYNLNVPQIYRPEECFSTTNNSRKALTCSVNHHLKIQCFQLNSTNVAISFEDMQSLYESEGYLDKEENTFHIFTGSPDLGSSVSLKPHDPVGDYMGEIFWNSAEAKSRILLIDPDEISRQWSPSGDTYPIQIAQFGLTHYSIYQNLNKLRRTFSLSRKSEGVVDIQQGFHAYLNCEPDSGDCLFGNVAGSVSVLLPKTKAFNNSTSLIASGVNWPPGTRLILNASLDMASKKFAEFQFVCSTSFGDGTVVLANRYWAIGYTKLHILKVVYYLKKCGNVNLLQNLEMVAMKAIHSLQSTKKPLRDQLLNSDIFKRLVMNAVELRYPKAENVGSIHRLLLFERFKQAESLKNANEIQYSMNIMFARERFMAVANWLVGNQAEDGSWPIGTRRDFTPRIYLTPGWCSAMGQGQGISVLVRAAHVSLGEAKRRFLLAAARALDPFYRYPVHHQMMPPPASHNESRLCGVRADFLGQTELPWYEEYPAKPSVFVLNGFIFSLVGLFDLSSTQMMTDEDVNLTTSRARSLLAQGVNTLVQVLPLYDSGIGSFYDLRHLSLEYSFQSTKPMARLEREKPGQMSTLQALLSAGPNRARWDYHTVHMNQLYQLAAVIAPQHADLWNVFFDRWMAYAWGFRSDHN